MKKLGLLLLMLIILPASAQEIAPLLLFTTGNNVYSTRVYVLNPVTKDQRKITDLTEWGDTGWSYDGQIIWAVDKFNEDHRRLRFFDVDSGAETVVSESILNSPCYPYISWSPDARYVAYLTGTEDEPVLNVRPLTDDRHPDTGYTLPSKFHNVPYWSPDGHYFLMFDQGLDGSFSLFTTAEDRELLNIVETAAYPMPVFSPDSRFVAYLNGTIWLYELTTGRKMDMGYRFNTIRWSPTGRYVVLEDARGYAGETSEHYLYYDTQTDTMHMLDLDYPLDTAGWMKQDTVLLLYADFAEEDGILLPRQVLAYDLASGETETVLQTTGWIDAVNVSREWVVITYSPDDFEHYQPTTQMQLSNGQRIIQKMLKLVRSYNGMMPGLAWLADGRWLALNAYDNPTRFDPDTETFLTIPAENRIGNSPLWSPDGRYLAYPVSDKSDPLALRDLENNILETLPTDQLLITIIGWQNSSVRQSMLYCGEG